MKSCAAMHALSILINTGGRILRPFNAKFKNTLESSTKMASFHAASGRLDIPDKSERLRHNLMTLPVGEVVRHRLKGSAIRGNVLPQRGGSRGTRPAFAEARSGSLTRRKDRGEDE